MYLSPGGNRRETIGNPPHPALWKHVPVLRGVADGEHAVVETLAGAAAHDPAGVRLPVRLRVHGDGERAAALHVRRV